MKIEGDRCVRVVKLGFRPSGEIEAVVAEVVDPDDEAVALVLDHVPQGFHVETLAHLREIHEKLEKNREIENDS